MDFIWAPDIPTTNTRSSKLPPPSSTDTTTTINNSMLHNNSNNENLSQLRTVGLRLSYPVASVSNSTNISFTNSANNHTSRHQRSRADTMPSTTLSPFLGTGGSLSTSLYNPNLTTQQRPNLHKRSESSSLTTLNTTTASNEVSSYHYDPSSGMSSPLDENASKSIASTLASLGLHDDNDDDHHHINKNSSNSSNRSSSSKDDHYVPLLTTTATTRNRSFTVSNQMDNEDMMSFSPFAQRTTRPRAISLGTAAGGFSPFVDSSLYNNSQQQQQDNSNLAADNILYQSRGNSSSLFAARMDSHEEEEQQQGFMDYQNSGNSEMDANACQTPSRALWLGNVSPSLSVPDLHKMFARYGRVESARILSDKECAFINFESGESALAAKEDLVNRLGSQVAGTVVKVGFGKADVDAAMALTVEQGPNAHGPTRSLWVGNIPANINPAILRSLFQSFGEIDSIRILSHKNCGFINFERQEDAVRARKMLQNKEILGAGTATVRIGFAKAPANNADEEIGDVVISGDNTITSYSTSGVAKKKSSPSPPNPTNNQQQQHQQESSGNTEGPNTNNTTQWATILLMASMMMNACTKVQQQGAGTPTEGSLSNSPSPSTSTSSTIQNSHYKRLASERKFIMQQLGYQDQTDEVARIPITYFSTIPPVPEFSSDRILSPLRLREIRKALDNGQIADIELVAQECMQEIVELCSDYIGNTVVQKLFEFCCEETKLAMLAKIAPWLASIGIHKNGTWAAQKIIDTANTDQLINLICTNIAPFVPLLLLDQFGNYVVQCCLRMGPTRNQYIFDAIVDKCWEIGQGRFGARAVRAILENAIVTKNQQIYVAAAIMQNALLLTTNANGSILLNWLLDTSGLLGHFRALCNNNMNMSS